MHFSSDFCRHQLAGGDRPTEERISPVEEENRGSQREKVILGSKKINLESFPYKNSHWQSLAYL